MRGKISKIISTTDADLLLSAFGIDRVKIKAAPPSHGVEPPLCSSGGDMRLLIAVMTCHRLDYYVDDLTVDWCTQNNLRCTDQQARVNTVRDTWVKDIPEGIEYRFFYGSRLNDLRQKPNGSVKTLPLTLRAPLADEVFLDCGDNYTQNPAKMKAICKWALNDYDYILRCDDDTFIYPDRLLINDQPHWMLRDYVGSATKDFHPGGCLFLSRRMMEKIIAAPITSYADDVWMGEVARNEHIPMHHIPTIRNQWGVGYKVPLDIDPTGLSAFHSCDPICMRRLHVVGKSSPTTSDSGSPTVSSTPTT